MPDLMDQIAIEKERKRWHRLAALMDDNTPKCSYCGGPLETIADPAIGVELICKNPDCESNN
jgi:hypothetical protein